MALGSLRGRKKTEKGSPSNWSVVRVWKSPNWAEDLARGFGPSTYVVLTCGIIFVVVLWNFRGIFEVIFVVISCDSLPANNGIIRRIGKWPTHM